MLLSLLLLLFIGIASAIFMLVSKGSERKRAMYLSLFVMLGLIVFMIFNAGVITKIMDTEFNGKHTSTTIGDLLGYTDGYNPYYGIWGGKNPDDDYDRDGIKNMFDPDADNDGVPDHKEYPFRFNAFEPDFGIDRLEVSWDSSNVIHIRAYPVKTYAGLTCYAYLCFDDFEIPGSSTIFDHAVEFTYQYPSDDRTHSFKVVLKTNDESKYANKANNELGYVLPGGILSAINYGFWYSNLEAAVHGVIRNTGLNIDPTLNPITNFFRSTIANVPLWAWIIILLIIIIVVLIIKYKPRVIYVSEKPSIWKRIYWRITGKKPEEYGRGDILVKIKKFK